MAEKTVQRECPACKDSIIFEVRAHDYYKLMHCCKCGVPVKKDLACYPIIDIVAYGKPQSESFKYSN